MTKEEYIKSEIDKDLQFWLKWPLLAAAFFFAFIGILDYIVTPENFIDFLKYRLFGAFACIGLVILNNKKLNRQYQLFLFYIGFLGSGIIIERMIIHFGGHTSTYYAGFFLVALYSIGFVPLNLKHSLSVSLIALLIYTVPILIFDRSLNPRYFIMPVFFLVSTLSSLIIWRYVSQQRLISELGLQFDIAQQKKQLEIYSLQLKGMVEDRTKDLRKSEQWHKSLFENATDGIVVLDKNGVIVNVNEKACQIHGFTVDELVGAHCSLLIEEDQAVLSERLRRLLAGESLIFETARKKKDGTLMFVEISSKAIPIEDEVFIQSFHRDITEKKKTQEHLLQSQKLESIGVLAGGIAHDFNNILTAMLGYTELIRRESEANEKVIKSVNIIESAARRAGRMISQLLDFSRKNVYEVLPLNVNDVVNDTVRLLERVIDKKISITLKLDDTLPLIEGDVNQMEQVIMNLLVNARDAMPEGGSITIDTSAVTAGEGAPAIPSYVPAGQYVLLRVSDTGIGIPEEIRNKIFEPFFTTKERGKGTGLGLSMVYGVVSEHKGYITVQSTLKEGTVFNVFLPVSSRVMKIEKGQAPYSVEGHETVLVVDDEEAILNFIKESLEVYGYNVLATGDPLDALDMFKKAPDNISLVITDIMMPLMNGRELAKEMRTIKPGVRILEISGYTGYVEEGADKSEGFVQKPFESLYLLSTVRKILDTKLRT
jgi:two-component system cell cycle sensor histidine kinase/response regulator CckA